MNFITILNWLLELEQSKETASLVATHKDTIYTKLALMPWIDDKLGHTLSGLTQISNIIAKIFCKVYYFSSSL